MAAERAKNVAVKPEMKLNLSAIKKCDQYVINILDTASQVALYKFNAESQAWEKTEVEGALFVYSRAASPRSAFFIMNRLNMKNMTEPITNNMEFKLQDPFLLFRNRTKDIFGIWFYDGQECKRLAGLMKMLSSETSVAGSGPVASSSNPETPKEVSQEPAAPPTEEKVDIMQLFVKAQERFDNQTKAGSSGKGAVPGPNTPQNRHQQPQQQQQQQQQQSQEQKAQQQMFLQQNQQQVEQLQQLLQTQEPPLRKHRAYSSPTPYLSGQPLPSPVAKGRGAHLENGLSPVGEGQYSSRGKEIVKSPPQSIVKVPSGAVVSLPTSKTQDDSAIESGRPGAQRKLFQSDRPEVNSTTSQAAPTQLSQAPAKDSPPKPLDQGGAAGASLMSPLAFQPSVRGPSVAPAPPKQAQKMEIAPLTQEQLVQALTYLLKNDSEFVSKIHEAYFKSLQERLPT